MHLYRLLYVVNRVVVLLLFACLHYSYAYDKCGRVTRITHDYDQVEEQSYSYYSSGRLATASNEHAQVQFRYDNMGLPVEERCNEHKIVRTYDQLGQISSLTSSLGAKLTYERNEFGEFINFSAQQGETEGQILSEHSYDSLNFELERMLPGSIRQSFAYDNIGRLVDSKTRQSSKLRRERKYHWGKANRLLKTEDSWYGTTSYEYNAPGICRRRPMPMVERNTAYPTRSVTSSMITTVSYAKNITRQKTAIL